MKDLAQHIFEASKPKEIETTFKGIDVILKPLNFKDETRLSLLLQKGETERFIWGRLCLCVLDPKTKEPIFKEDHFEQFKNSAVDSEWHKIQDLIIHGSEGSNLKEDVTEASKN